MLAIIMKINQVLIKEYTEKFNPMFNRYILQILGIPTE